MAAFVPLSFIMNSNAVATEREKEPSEYWIWSTELLLKDTAGVVAKYHPGRAAN